MGLLPEFVYEYGSIALESEDILVAYTDGISEAMNSEDEEWGEARMLEAIENCSGLCAAAMIEQLMTEADRFAGGAPQHDDMTLVVIRAV